MKLFWIDNNNFVTYQQLVADLNSLEFGKSYIWEKSTYHVFLHLLHSIINDYPVTLLDGDFSETEIAANGLKLSELSNSFNTNNKVNCYQDIIKKTKILKEWRLTLLTSGTTGLPKKVRHSFASISRAVKISDEHQNDVWGFAYNPTHIAGIQVFLQAFMNGNPLVNLYKKDPMQIHKQIDDNKVTHISATPTFYRLFLNDNLKIPHVRQISLGGEKLPLSLKERLLKCFPNAKIRNIYASTEAGSLFASDGENFRIPKQHENKIKIVNNEILIHSSLLGESESFDLIDDWYHTGDLVEIITEVPYITFKFISRKNEMINVGGFKVNPYEVEEALIRIPQIKEAKVFGKPNPVLGQILMADVVANNITEKEIRNKLNLQNFKIPRIINFVEKIEVTRTGKVKR